MRLPMNTSLATLKPSGIRRINALAAQHPGCIALALGEPDFPTPDVISAEVTASLDRGDTHYPPNNGRPALREALSAYMGDAGLTFSADEVILTDGATEALSATFMAMLNPGDEVIIPTPAFGLYESIVVANHAKAVFLDTEPAQFQIDEDALRACVTPATNLENMPLEFEIWEGMPYEDGSTKLLNAVYDKPSVWNTYQEETFVLNKPLKGVTSVGFVFTRKAHIKGFSFKRENGAYKINYPAVCKKIYGDTFTVNEDAVCGIGNNVTFVYENMDFEEGTGRVVICARTKLPNNTVHIRFRKGAESINKIIEFGYADDYIEREYELTGISGAYDEVLFVFLPGSNFDFKWFRFEK